MQDDAYIVKSQCLHESVPARAISSNFQEVRRRPGQNQLFYDPYMEAFQENYT